MNSEHSGQHHDHAHHHSHSSSVLKSTSSNVIDPVCGMTVKPESPHATDLDGVHYRFCSAKCKTKFDAEPARYLAPQPAEPAIPDAEYTCPMHPEIRQIGPGTCPKCGMALEPLLPDLDEDEENPSTGFPPPLLGSLPLTVHRGRPGDGRAPAGRPVAMGHALGANCCSACPSCCGPARRFSCVAGSRWSSAVPICGH
jgi:YHS domain-containing protein